MTLEEKISELVSLQGGEAPKAMTDTFEALGFDSLDTIELIMEVEDHFGLEVDDGVAMAMKCPADVVEYLKNRGKVEG